MAALGRSLATATAASIVFASAAATAPYLALASAGVPRGRALFATAFALGTPWFFWLAAAPVPEAFTASLTAAAALGLGARSERALTPRVRIAFVLAIAAAALSRYEPWPVAAVLAAVLGARGLRAVGPARRTLGLAALGCALGPLLWMAWNAHAHDGPLHFFRRVSSYKRAIGEGSTDTVAALLLYPRLLFTTRPELVVPFGFLLVPALRDRDVRARWGIPLLCAAAQIAFLAYGNARDGAPAHHPERALLGGLVVLGLFTADAGLVKLRELASSGGRGIAARGAAACIAVAWVIATARGLSPPGLGPTEERTSQVARGAKLREDGVERIVVTPCAYEHFALIAAFGAPERVETKPRGIPADGQCPAVEPR